MKMKMNKKKIQLHNNIFKGFYYFLIKVIGVTTLKGHVNVLNWLLKNNNKAKLISILKKLKLAFEADIKFYNSEGKELEKLIESAIKLSTKNMKLLLDIRNGNSIIISDADTKDLYNVKFKHEKYNGYKNQFTNIDYQRILMILEQTIKEANQKRFKHSVLKSINRMNELANLGFSELESLRSRVEIWTSGNCEINDGANPGGWAHILVLANIQNTEMIYSGSYAMVTEYQLGLIVVKEGIENAIKLGYTNIKVNSDSKEVVDVCLNKMFVWEQNGWLIDDKTQPKYLDLVKDLYELFTLDDCDITINLIDTNWRIPLDYKVVNLAKKEAKEEQSRLKRLEKENPKHLDFQTYRYLRRKMLNK